MSNEPLAILFGCVGETLSAEERAFFADANPLGFILFQRNCRDPDQVRGLVAEFRACVGRAAAPVLIDQEGGRVARLKPPRWRAYPAAARLAALPDAEEAVRLGARLIADDLAALGVTVDCLPVLDLPVAGADNVIGDRAYGGEPALVARLGRAACEGLLAGGVLPVVKHMPGHGRSHADSHLNLPVVEASHAALAARDFAPFRVNSDLPMAMTAHVVFAALDPDHPATTSRRAIRQVIRGEIGFDGLLLTDDLSMKALSGDFETRARDALAAGCDVVLHCNGVMAEMTAVAGGARPLAGAAARRAKAALGRLAKAPEPFDVDAGRARFAAAFEGRWAA